MPFRDFTGSRLCQTPEIARIDHSFTIDKPAELAQAMFVRDIAPELAKDRDFQIAHERPGQLVFSDGIATAGDEASVLEEGTHDEEPWARLPLVGRVGPARFLQRFGLAGGDELTEVLPRHIKVDFTPEGPGTRCWGRRSIGRKSQISPTTDRAGVFIGGLRLPRPWAAR
jgi:hypothetical protein